MPRRAPRQTWECNLWMRNGRASYMFSYSVTVFASKARVSQTDKVQLRPQQLASTEISRLRNDAVRLTSNQCCFPHFGMSHPVVTWADPAGNPTSVTRRIGTDVTRSARVMHIPPARFVAPALGNRASALRAASWCGSAVASSAKAAAHCRRASKPETKTLRRYNRPDRL